MHFAYTEVDFKLEGDERKNIDTDFEYTQGNILVAELLFAKDMGDRNIL